MSHTQSRGFLRELVRIQWRAWVLSFPIGVAFLTTIVRNRRVKEHDVGPESHPFDPATP